MGYMMYEELIIPVIGMGLFSIFAMTGLRLWYILKQDEKTAKKVTGLIIKVSKLEGILKSGGAISPPSRTLPSMQDMSLEDVAESLGLDAKELNNPLVRPLAEKIFKKLQDGGEGGEDGKKTEIVFR